MRVRILMAGILSILGTTWFGLCFIHSAWMTGTPVPDPTPYQRHALIYFILTVSCALAALGILIFTWFHRPAGSPKDT